MYWYATMKLLAKTSRLRSMQWIFATIAHMLAINCFIKNIQLLFAMFSFKVDILPVTHVSLKLLIIWSLSIF